MDNENILTKAALLIVYEDGNYTIVPKMEDYECHIHYIDYEIYVNQNKKLEELLQKCDLEKILDLPSLFSEVINELTLNGSILLTNFACNYIGPTNYFGAYLPNKVSEKQKETINELEAYIKELEFDHIATYSDEYKRAKTTGSIDLIEYIKEMVK